MWRWAARALRRAGLEPRWRRIRSEAESAAGAQPVKLVVGLGNPGRKYQGTRHNVGFEVLTRVAQQQGGGPSRERFQGELNDVVTPAGRVLLLRPLTYMNRSGQSVRAACDFYQLPLPNLLVVCDDLNLELGRLRFRAQGSAGGQKGLADIIARLGSDQFARLRVGIGGPPEGWDAADYVLSRFTPTDRPEADLAVDRAAQGVVDWLARGLDYCMNQYNSGL